MDNILLLQRIILDPKIVQGKLIIKGTNFSVHFILKLLSEGDTVDELLEKYSELERQDIIACLLFDSKYMESISFMP